MIKQPCRFGGLNELILTEIKHFCNKLECKIKDFLVVKWAREG